MRKRVARAKTVYCSHTSYDEGDVVHPDSDEESVQSEPAEEPPNQQFGPFELVEELGRGGAGQVHRALWPTRPGKPPRVVAVKRLFAESEMRTDMRQRFEQEAKLMTEMRHPNIVASYKFGEADGQLYCAMEYVDGFTLATLIAEAKKTTAVLSPAVVAYIGHEVCNALAHAAAHGVIHRDISPSNILIRNDGVVKLSDFGVARVFSHTPSGASFTHAFGKCPYMAYETLCDGETSELADLCSLGVCLAELLALQVPYTERRLRAARAERTGVDPAAWLGEHCHQAPQALRETIASLMSLDTLERPRSARDVRQHFAKHFRTQQAARELEAFMGVVDTRHALPTQTELLSGAQPTLLSTRRMIQEHLPRLRSSVRAFAQRTRTEHLVDDLMGEAQIALLEAVRTFLRSSAFEKGVPFSRYASVAMRNAMVDCASRNGVKRSAIAAAKKASKALRESSEAPDFQRALNMTYLAATQEHILCAKREASTRLMSQPPKPPDQDGLQLARSLVAGVQDDTARTILSLRWFEGMSYRNIGRRLSVADCKVREIERLTLEGIRREIGLDL